MEQKMGFIYSELTKAEEDEKKNELNNLILSSMQKKIFEKLKSELSYDYIISSFEEDDIKYTSKELKRQATEIEKELNSTLNDRKSEILHFLPSNILKEIRLIFYSDSKGIFKLYSKKFNDLFYGICKNSHGKLLDLSKAFTKQEISKIVIEENNNFNLKLLTETPTQDFKDICNLLLIFNKEINVENVMNLILELNIK